MDEQWEEKLKEKHIPDIKYFHSSVNNTKCSIDDCEYAKEIYKLFNCDNNGYTPLHAKSDVLLLADVFAEKDYRKYMV